MGRIVIPRYQRQRAQLKQRPKGSGYFANGFGPQEMSLISKLTDLAVAGGGQIARAVQIGNREEEQAKAQADYDRKIQTNAEERRAAAQGLVDATDIDGQVEAFFAQQEPPSVRERLPSMSSMNLQSDLVQPRPMQGGALSPGVLARPGLLAPEDLSMARAQMATMLQADAMESAMQRPDVAAVFDYGDEAGFEAVEDAMRRGVVDPTGVPRTSVGKAEGIMNAASTRAYSDALQRLEQLDRQGAQESVRRLSSPLVPQEQMLDLVSRYDVSPGSLERMNQRSADYSAYTPDELVAAGVSLPAAPTRQGVQLGRPSAFSAADEYGSVQRRAEREREMQGRDFRQEAIEEIGPAPEAKPFRISDILAQASSARTVEQRAMLLQAAADSPDIQASNLSDLAKGAYRDRAMQAVMELFPKEDKEMSKLDRARYEQITARTDLIDLRRKNLEQKMGDVSRAKSISPAVRRSRSPEINDSFDSVVAWTEHSEDRDAKRGQFSDDAIFVELTAAAEERAAQEGRQPTQQEMAFNAADIDRGRKAKFKRLVGRYSDATPDTILGLVARDMPGRRQKSLRKTVLDMVGKVGDRKKALVGAKIKDDSAVVRSDLAENRQLAVGAARSEDKAKAAETAHGYKKEIIGIKDKNTQRNIAVRHSNTLAQLSKRIELTEAMRSRLNADNQKAKRQLVALKASIKPKAPSAQVVSLRRQRVKYVAAKKASTSPIATAYYNTYIQGLDKILEDVQQAPKATPAQQAQPTGSVYNATTNTTE